MSITTEGDGTHECYNNHELILFTCGGSWAGKCNTTDGACMCRYGWVGHADFFTMDQERWGGTVRDCQTNIVAIRILWTFALFQLLYVLMWLLPLAARDQIRSYRNIPTIKSWPQHKPLLLIVLDVFSLLGACVMCLYKIFLPIRDVLIMIDKIPTFLFIVPLTMAFGMAYAYEQYLLSLILLSPAHRSKSMEERKETLHFETKILRFGWAVLAFSGVPVVLVPLMNVFFGMDPSREHVNIQDSIFCVVTGIGLMGVTQLCRRLKFHIASLFDILSSEASCAAERNQLKMTKSRLFAIQDTFIFHMMFQGICLMILIFVPPLWSKATYIFPSLYISVAIVNGQAVRGYTFTYFYDKGALASTDEEEAEARNTDDEFEDLDDDEMKVPLYEAFDCDGLVDDE